MALERMAVGVMLGVGENPTESIRKVLDVGVNNAQMGRPGDEWLAGEKAAELKIRGLDDDAKPAKVLGCEVVAAHIGFVPEDASDPDYEDVVDVVREFTDYLAGNGQKLSLETGQETGPCLLRFLKDIGRDNVRVNFDPANMILYGSGDPIEALSLVGEHVIGVHCKDGTGPTEPDQLGTETPLGAGDVGIERFVQTLVDLGYAGPLTIEREITGEQQKADIIAARQLLEQIRDKILA